VLDVGAVNADLDRQAVKHSQGHLPTRLRVLLHNVIISMVVNVILLREICDQKPRILLLLYV